MNHETRSISEGALMCAIVGVLLFVNRQLANAIEVLMYWILTFPILVYTARYGLKKGILVSICMMLMSIMIATPTTIMYLLICNGCGVAYGYGILKGWKNSSLLWVSGLLNFIACICTGVIFASFFGYDLNEDVELLRMLLEVCGLSKLSDSSLVVGGFLTIVSLVMAVLQTICIHMVAQLFLPRFKIKVNGLKSVLQMRMSSGMVYIFISIWMLFLVGNVLKLSESLMSVLFLLAICSLIMMVAYGLFVCMIYAGIHHNRKYILFSLLLLIVPFAQLILICIGMYDGLGGNYLRRI